MAPTSSEPCRGARTEREQRPLAAAPGGHERGRSREPRGRHDHPRRPRPDETQTVREPARLDLCGAGTVPDVARTPPVGAEPQHRHDGQCDRDERPAGRLASPQPHGVDDEERPGLGAFERATRSPGAAPGACRPSRWRSTAHRQSVAVTGAECPSTTRRRKRGPPSGVSSRRPAATTPAAGPANRAASRYVTTTASRPAVLATTSHRVGARSPTMRQHGGHQDREGLPRRSAGGVEVEVADLAPPDEPGPRVERQRRGQRQGQHRDGGAHRDHHGTLRHPPPSDRRRVAARDRTATSSTTVTVVTRRPPARSPVRPPTRAPRRPGATATSRDCGCGAAARSGARVG